MIFSFLQLERLFLTPLHLFTLSEIVVSLFIVSFDGMNQLYVNQHTHQ
jgi:hypothetical protein